MRNNKEKMVDFLVEGFYDEDLKQEEMISEGFMDAHFSGIDKDELSRLRQVARSKKMDKYEKEKALEDIDDLIDNSNRVLTSYNIPHFLAGAVMNSVTAGLSSLIKVVNRASNARDRKSYREALHQIRSVIVAIKTTK